MQPATINAIMQINAIFINFFILSHRVKLIKDMLPWWQASICYCISLHRFANQYQSR